MIKSLSDQRNWIRPRNIKTVNSIWIVKKLLSSTNANLNISDKTLDAILDDKFKIKSHLIRAALKS